MSRLSSFEKLQWVCVLPAAVVGGILVHFIVSLGRQFVLSNWTSMAGSNFALAIQLFAFAVASGAFVLAGGFTAPRYRRRTAFVLTVLGTLLSLAKHVLLQSHPGVTNYLHFAAEAIGGMGASAMMIVGADRVLPGPNQGVEN